MRPLVSIITPTYNRAYILDKAIKSVLAQTYSNWELIIVDDGSSDTTKDLVKSFKEQRIKYYYQKNQGPIIARNNGMERAQGEWIAYLDSDNILYPNYLETILDWISKNSKTMWGFPKARRIKELYEGGKLVKTIDDSDDYPDTVSVQDIFYRKLHTDTTGSFHSRRVIDEGVRFDPEVAKIEDWDFFLTLGTKYPYGFLYIPIVLNNYYQRYGTDGIVSNSTYRDWAEIFERIYQKHKNAPLMKGQQWYPDRVEKWNKLADDFEKGLLPPYYLYYFREDKNKK